MKTILKFLLCMMISSQSLAVGRSACSTLWIQNRVAEINDQSLSFVRDFFSPQEQRSWVARQLIQRALKSKNIRKISLQEDTDLASQNLYRQMSLFTGKNKQSLETQWIELALFTQGLKPFVKNYQELVSQSDFRIKLTRILSDPLVQFLANPSRLPSERDPQVPPALLTKIFMDGIPAHKLEIEEAYVQAGMIKADFFHGLQAVYRVSFLVVLFIIILQTDEDAQGPKSPMKREELLQNMDNLTESLNQFDQILQPKGFYKQSHK